MLVQVYQRLRSSVSLFGILLAILMAGCNSSPGTREGSPEVSLTTFRSERELESYLKEQFAASVLSRAAYNFGMISMPVFLGDTELDQNNAVGSQAGAAANDFSQTNVQETGVDEADRVKTDGAYMYVAGLRKVSVINAVPPEAMSVVSTVDVSGTVSSLYLFDNILVILYTPDSGSGQSWSGTDLTGMADIGMPYWIPTNIQTGVLLADVTDPSNPIIIKEIKTDGMLVSSRLTGGKLHIVQQFLPNLPPLRLWHDGSAASYNGAVEANRRNLETLTLNDLIPFQETLDPSGNIIKSGQLVIPENFYRPSGPAGGSIVTLLTINMNDPSLESSSLGMVADAHLIYASQQSLYIGATIWDETPALLEFDQRQQTIIHKFDLTGDEVQAVGSGRVQGRVLNQFSLGEYEGVLRIATTTGEGWWANSSLSNHVYSLKILDNKLKIIGRLEGLAPGEEIYSARFIGSRGYLVTFVKVDPLFTLDLSDPSNPRVIGELKVPGYSDYIHPLGENHLLTIGKDAELRDGTTWYQGLQLSVFDISDFANPTLLHKELIGDRGTSSEALFNHKAFTFWAENDLLAIPVKLYEHENIPENVWEFGTRTFNGLYVYRTTAENGFELLGRISTGLPSNFNDWTRGVFIGDTVYTVNGDTLRSAALADIENTARVLPLIE